MPDRPSLDATQTSAPIATSAPVTALIETIIPSLTEAFTPTSEQGFTPTPPNTFGTPASSLSRVDRYQVIFYDQVPEVLALMWYRQYPQAIASWDEMLSQLPDYGYAHFQRAYSYLQLALQSQSSEEAKSGLKQALLDVESAIELGPLAGDHLLLRSQIYEQLARLEPKREKRLEWFELALDDAYEADRLGSSDSAAALYPLSLLRDLGRCQESLDGFSRLMIQELDAAQRADMNTGLAESYLCFGWLDPALVHIDLAQQDRPSAERQIVKAIVLHNLGELETARAFLNASIESQPDGGTERYFLRALVNYDLGEYEIARADLEFAAGRIQDVRGLGAYVSGLLAVQDGDVARGKTMIAYAEETLDFGYGPLLNRVRRELELPEISLGVPNVPVEIAPTLTAMSAIRATSALTETPGLVASEILTSTVTPSPPVTKIVAGTGSPTSTATAAPPSSPTATETPTEAPTLMPTLTATSTPVYSYNERPLYVTRDLVVPYDGTGSFLLGTQPGGLTFYFAPPEPVEFEKVISLNFYLSPADAGIPIDLLLQLFRYENPEIFTGAPPMEGDWGGNLYKPFEGFIHRQGGMYVRLINREAAPVEIGNLGLEIVLQKEDGSQAVYGDSVP